MIRNGTDGSTMIDWQGTAKFNIFFWLWILMGFSLLAIHVLSSGGNLSQSAGPAFATGVGQGSEGSGCQIPISQFVKNFK